MRKPVFYPTANGKEDFTDGAFGGVESGSCEPRMAKPKGKGSAVPRIREVPAVAIVAWVIAIINQLSVKSEQLPVLGYLFGLSVIRLTNGVTKKRSLYEFNLISVCFAQ